MELDPIVVQASFSVPLALAFALYTLVRRDHTQLHRLSAGIVASLACWMFALVLHRVSDAPAISSDVQYSPT